MKTRSEFFANGYDDFNDGLDRDENPYAPGTAAHEQWEGGYIQAAEDYDPTPCCPAHSHFVSNCDFPGYAANH